MGDCLGDESFDRVRIQNHLGVKGKTLIASPDREAGEQTEQSPQLVPLHRIQSTGPFADDRTHLLPRKRVDAPRSVVLKPPMDLWRLVSRAARRLRHVETS